MKNHPAANALPKMSTADFLSLKADIALHGLREPIWVKDGKIIDGRHRWRACNELGVECEAREFAGGDILSFVISANVMRRHLNGKQKRGVIKKLLREAPTRSNRSIAKTMQVSHHTVASVRAEAAGGQIAHPVVSSLGDLHARRILKELDAIDASQLSDADGFLNALRAQLHRLADRLAGSLLIAK